MILWCGLIFQSHVVLVPKASGMVLQWIDGRGGSMLRNDALIPISASDTACLRSTAEDAANR
jgi:hypothetical protein